MLTESRGWRRKIGLATLVIALVGMSGWVRSLIVVDCVRFPQGVSSWIDLFSLDGTILWHRDHEDWSRSVPIRFQWQTQSLAEFKPAEVDRRVPLLGRWCGFGWHDRWRACGIGPLAEHPHDVTIIIPYWIIVLPLTLIAANLLLCRPRSRKPVPSVRHNESDLSLHTQEDHQHAKLQEKGDGSRH